MAGHVFISHGSENRDEANALCAYIESRGVKCWIAPRDVRPGIDYSEELQAAIETCAAFVVLVTDMANKSPYVRAETEMAFSSHKPIFPVRQADIKPAAGLALFLKIRHWTDAYGKYRDAAMERLALELQTVVGVAAATPAPAPIPAPAPSPAPAPPPPLSDAAPPAPVPAPAAPVPAPVPTAQPNQERLDAAIGPKAQLYLARWQAMDAKRSQFGWNWAACLASLFWFAYRRMWAPAIVLGLVFVALNALSLLSKPLMVTGGLLSIVAVTAAAMLGDSFYRQHVGRLVRQSAGMEREPALAFLRSRGGVSTQAVVVLSVIAVAVAAAFAFIGLREAAAPPGGGLVRDDPFFRGATSGPGNSAVTPPEVGAQVPGATTPGTNPGTTTPGVGPNGEVDEEALRNAIEEARNMLEQQGVTEEQLQQIQRGY